jgi:hypothetical protein
MSTTGESTMLTASELRLLREVVAARIASRVSPGMKRLSAKLKAEADRA